MSLREQIREITDAVTEPLSTPEWPDLDGQLFIRSLTAAERDRWEASNLIRDSRTGTRKPRLDNLRARFAVLVVVDGDGRRIFQDSDADWLGTKSSKVLDRIWEAGNRLNAVRDSDVEELEKNSGPTTGNGSGSASASLPEGSTSSAP